MRNKRRKNSCQGDSEDEVWMFGMLWKSIHESKVSEEAGHFPPQVTLISHQVG